MRCKERRCPACAAISGGREISAVKVDGERLYARARRGDDVVAPERDVFVHELEILRVAVPEIALRVRCNKGFYAGVGA